MFLLYFEKSFKTRPVLVFSISGLVHFPPGDDWVDYWAPSTSFAGGTSATVPAPLTTLPLFQRKGAVLAQLDLHDSSTLVLRTHAGGARPKRKTRHGLGPRAILSTAGACGCYISYNRVLRAVLQNTLRWGIF